MRQFSINVLNPSEGECAGLHDRHHLPTKEPYQILYQIDSNRWMPIRADRCSFLGMARKIPNKYGPMRAIPTLASNR
jgi:hypothetical protein